MKDAERRCRRRTIWRECFPKFLRGEVARHLAHQRTAADIAVRLGIRVSTAEKIILALSKEKRLTRGV